MGAHCIKRKLSRIYDTYQLTDVMANLPVLENISHVETKINQTELGMKRATVD